MQQSRPEDPKSATPPRTPTEVGKDLKADFTELWETLRERAKHTFARIEVKDLLEVRSLDDLRRMVKQAYAYDDAQLDVEIDRFMNEGGAPVNRQS